MRRLRRLIERRPRLSRRALVMLGLAAGFLLLAYPLAEASDVLSNVAPASQLPGGSLTNAYPLGNYSLDHHFDAVSASLTGGVDASGVAPTIAWFLAELFWELTVFMANAVITLFTFAFSLDLVNGSSATGGAGALAPVSVAVRSIYRDTFGEPWLVVAILLVGLWAMWHALVRRKYTETAGALGMSVVFVVIALAFVSRPEIIGQASRLTNQMSSAFLALGSHGSLGNVEQAKQADADQLFLSLVVEPWTVLNFGGLEHCVTGSGDDQRSVAVRPLSRDPGRDAALSRRLAAGTQVQADGKVCINNRNRYAAHFLRFAPETDERNAEYEALKDGDTSKLPDADPAKADGSYQLGDPDKPAAEAMGKGGQYQRLLLALVIFVGELGAFLLLGAVAVAVILAQVLVLLLLAFAPIALVIGVIPGRGHEFFIGWLQRLASYLLRKAIYSLVLAVLLTVSSALADATSNLGWLLAFGLQAVFYWTVLLQRRQLVGQLSHVATGHGRVESDGLGRAAVIAAVATRLATRNPKPPPPPGSGEGSGQPPHPGSSSAGDGASPEPPPNADGPTPHDPSAGGGSGSTRPPDPAPTASGGRRGPRDDSTSPGDTAAPVTPEPAASPEPHRAPDPGARADQADADEDDAHSAPNVEPSDQPGSKPPTTRTTTSAADRAGERRGEQATAAPELHAQDAGAGAREVLQDSPLRQGLSDDARRLHESRPPSPPASATAAPPPTTASPPPIAPPAASPPGTPPVRRPHETAAEPASAPPLDGDSEVQR